MSTSDDTSAITGVNTQKDEDVNVKPLIFKAVYLSLCFMLLFSAFNSAQNMVSTVYATLGYKNLGNIALFSLYFAFGIASFFGAQMVSVASPKVIFIVSGVCYNLFVLVGFIVVHCPDHQGEFQCKQGVIYAYIIFASILCGIAAATIWVSQGAYIEALGAKCPSKSGLFVGIFWAVMQTSQILGNVMSFALLGLNNGTIIYFTIILIIGGIGNLMFFFLPSVKADSAKKETPKIKTMINLIKVKEVRPLMLFMGFAGIIVAFYSGFLGGLIKSTLPDDVRADDNATNQKVAQVFIVLGVSEVVSGLTSGRLTQKFNLYNLATIGTLLAELGLMLSLLGSLLIPKSYGLCFGIAAIWGFIDCYFNVVTQEICNKDYPGLIEIFALFRLLLAMSNSFTQVLAIVIPDDKQWIFILIITAFQMATLMGTKLLKKPDLSGVKPENEEPMLQDSRSGSINQDNDYEQNHTQKI